MGLFCVEHRTAISKTDDSSWECWKCLIKRAEQAERERDEARAKVATLYQLIVRLCSTLDWAATPLVTQTQLWTTIDGLIDPFKLDAQRAALEDK